MDENLETDITMADIDQLIELLGARVADEQQETPSEPPPVESQEVS